MYIIYTQYLYCLNFKVSENLCISYEVIVTLQKYLRDICKDLNMEEEEKKNRLRFLCEKIFKIGPNVSFAEQEKNELFIYLNNHNFRKYFLITLSRQRTKGRFERSDKLINCLSEILHMILDLAEKENDYENAKNCLILSQTFYKEIPINENESNIKNNKIIKRKK